MKWSSVNLPLKNLVINLLSLNKAAGSSSKPKIKKGITYATEGAVIMPNIGEVGSVIGSLQELNSDLLKHYQILIFLKH